MASDLMNMHREIIDAAISDQTTMLESISREIWENPELGYSEERAHGLITSYLKQVGFRNVEKSYIVPTAFRAAYGADDQRTNRNIAIICEYDALPEIGHACGHNLITQVGLTAAVAVKAFIDKTKMSNAKLTVIGTPAEEIGGGKIDLIRGGAFKNIDCAMMAHPFAHDLLCPVMLANEMISVSFFGKAAHAAAGPWQGVNAVDAAVSCYNGISMLRQQVKPDSRIHVIITNGGVKTNIIPKESSLEIMIRSPNENDVKALHDKVENCIKGAAQVTGCRAEVKVGRKPYQSVLHNMCMANTYKDAAQNLGVTFIEGPQPASGSTDMGNVSHVVPSIHPKFSIGTSSNIHTIEFQQAAGQKIASDFAFDAGRALAHTAINIFSNDQLFNDIVREFNSHS